MESLTDLFDDDLLVVIAHWQDAHPEETVWLIDYGNVVLALAYSPGDCWPLTKANAARRYFPEESMLLDMDVSEDEVHRMLLRLSDWCKEKPEFMEGRAQQSVVFQVDEDGFEYTIFERRTLH